MSNSKPIFGYWDLRGFGQCIRHVLHYLNVDYEERTYVIGDPPSMDEWLGDKFKLGLQFPNLPYWIEKDTGLKLSESHAILKHIARERGPELMPKTSAEHRDVDVIEYLTLDIHLLLVQVCYSYTVELEQRLEESAKLKFEQLSKFFEGKQWTLGSRLSYVDFFLYEALYQIKIYNSELVEAHPVLVAYMKRFEALPSMVKYMSSPGYYKGPCFSAWAIKKI